MMEDFGYFGDEIFFGHCVDDYIMDDLFIQADRQQEIDELWAEYFIEEEEDERMCRGLDNAFEGRTDIGWD